MRRPLLLVASLLIVTAGSLAHAQLVLVAAKKVLVKNVIPDDPSRNKLVMVAKDLAITTPLPGAPGDPRCVFVPPGTHTMQVVVTGGVFTIEGLPCEHWSLLGSEAKPKGYRYKGSELSPVKRVVWKPGQIKIQLKGKGPVQLFVELTPGVPVSAPVEVTLLGNGTGHCVACEPFNGKDGSDGKTFLGKDCPAPAFCVASPSGAFLEESVE